LTGARFTDKLRGVDEIKIRLSDQFLALALECEHEVLTMRELITALGVRGHGFLALLFSVPFVSPVPLPGLSMVFGLVVIVAGLGIGFDFKIWLPEWMMRRSLPGHLLARVFRAGAALLKKIEKILKPRIFNLSESPPVRMAAGLAIAFSGFVLALPLPPGTNFPPAAVCVLLSLGILERDGLFLILGFIAFILKITVITGLLIYAYHHRHGVFGFF
jgi:hypothetical protein